MPNFWNALKNLFREAADSSPNEPAIHEMLSRDEAQREGYETWKGSLPMRRLIDWLAGQYATYRVAPQDIDPAIDFLNTPSSKGFVVHFNQTQHTPTEIRHFFDYLKERVRSGEYKSQLSDTRTYNRPNWVETVERHYLKPRTQYLTDGTIDQRFGNILIELEFRDDKPHHLRFRANSYNDRLYAEAGAFKELMAVLAE